MSDFKTAFRDGLDAAQKAKLAKAEIDNVFKDLNQQLLEVSEGKLAIERKLLERPHNWFQSISIMTASSEHYWAIVAINPLVEGSSEYELCEWEIGQAGYPCKLTWGGNEHYCEDKQALEINLSNLLRDPIIAERLLYLMNIKKKN